MLAKIFIHNGNCQCELFTHKVLPDGQIETVRKPRHSAHVAPLGGVWSQLQVIGLKRFLDQMLRSNPHLWPWDVIAHEEYNRDGCRVPFLQTLLGTLEC